MTSKWLVHFYYGIKPILPRRVQLGLRRAIAFWKRRASSRTWPIDPEAAACPPGWAGWPGGKDFALVLVHDVDTIKGVANCRPLMDLERQQGFRSSFNFVPERYRQDAGLQAEITSSGFEIGVHGLKHDGKLFKRRPIFDERAPMVNAYIDQWKAVGFTAPSMLRNLNWIAELNIQYSCSSFDTDPFEPQSDAVKAIFPFIVHDGAFKRHYVEMPYTLPQDHCLFIILREKNIRIWVDKLDWIAKHGGLALFISHPDYMNFSGGRCSFNEYPSALYAEFLSHIGDRYRDRYWHALPREVARYWKEAMMRDASG